VVQHFVSKFRAKFGETPDALAVLGYDAGRLLFHAIAQAGSVEGSKLRDAIASTKDFRGVAGLVTIDRERNATKTAVIIAIANGKPSLKETIFPPNS